MSVVNHWGKWVSTSLPITGVVSLNSLEHIHDLVNGGDAIDLTYEEGLKEFLREKSTERERAILDSEDDSAVYDKVAMIPTEEEIAQWTEEYNELMQYYDEPGRYLVGAWRKDDQGLYEPDDLTTENDFAAIVDYDTMTAQVVSSKWAIRAALCSPCYPGQADVDTPGEFMGYDFPDWVYGDHRQNRDSVRFHRVDTEGKFWQVIAPTQILYTVVVQVRKVIDGVVQEDYYNNIQDYYSGEEDGLFRGTCQAPRGDLQRVNNIARGAWHIIDDQLRSIPE